MNRNYKVIWNASLSCFMAVSEYAKARGKSSKSSVSSNATINTTSTLSSTSAFRLTAIGLGLMAAGLTMSPQVFAVTGVGGAVDTGVTNCGTNASAGKTGSVAVGCNSVADLSADPAVNFYQRGNPDNLAIDISTAFNSTAVGTGARATEAGTSLGMNASSRNLGIAVGIQAKSENVAAVAIGPAALAKGNTSLALGRQSAATKDFAQAIGNVSSATGEASLAVGHSARAEGYRSIAIGSTDTKKAGNTGGQLGVAYQAAEQTLATGDDSIAFGSGAKATATNAIAVGTNSKVTGDNTVSVGWNSGIGSTQSEGVSVGNRSGQNVISNGNVALGLDAGSNVGFTPRATVTTGVAAYRPYTIVGQNTGVGAAAGNEVYGDSNSALGERAGRNVDGHANTAVGAFSGNAVIGSANVAMGPTSGYTVKGDRNTAVGNFSGSNVVGKVNSAFGNGAGSNVTGEYNLALGATAGAGITNDLTIAIGNNAGNIINGNIGKNSISVGSNSSAQGNSSMALGRGAVSAGINAVGIGVESISSAAGAVAVGNKAEASGENAIAIGKGSLATGSQAIGVGSRAGNGGAAYGDNADAGGTIISVTPTVMQGTAIGNGSIVNVNNGVALGSKSVASRAGTVTGPVFIPTSATTADINDINLTKSGVLGAVSVGNNKDGTRQIINVAAGSSDSDAVNISQLKGVANSISTNKTKYYSVNSTGGTNDDNLGASGPNAMAMGRNSVASGSQAISIGSGASGQQTTASGEQSIAIGANTVSKGASSIAIGGDDLDAASKANLTGAASGTVNGGSVNTTFKAYTGRDLVETPPYQVNTESGGAASIAMGAKALSQGALSTAIGVQSSTTGVASSAFGVGSSATKEGSVALGAGSVANVAGGAVGYVPTGASITETNAINATQSGARSGAVSVGTSAKGGNRQIVNLAAGTTDSDAVNVAQLRGGVSGVIDLGLNFTGDNTATTVNRKLGEKLIVKGGATTTLSDNNIGVVASSPDTLTVKLAKDLTGLTSVTTGNTVMNTSGVTLTGGSNQTVTLSNSGLNNGGNQITNVASGGTTLTNAANIGDVNSAAVGSRTEVVKGTNVTSVGKTTGTSGQDIYTVNANGTTVSSANSGALTVTPGTKDANNVTDYKVDLGSDTKASLGKADNALQSVVTQIDGVAVKTITKVNNTANFLKGDNILLTPETGGSIKVALAKDLIGLNSANIGGVTISAAGINANNTQIKGVLAGSAPNDAVNVSQLNLANTNIDKGLNFGGDSGTDVNRKLGQKLIVKGGDTINADPATKNISVTANGDDTLTVRLIKDINLGETGSVTTGNTQVNNAGLTLYNGDNNQVALTNNGLNNGNNKITNVADGLLSATSKDAVNGSQLFKTNDEIAKGIKIGDGNSANDQQFALGSTINVTGDSNITTTASATGVQVKLNNQLNLGNDGRMQMGNSLMNNTGFTFVGNQPGSTVILGAGGLNNGFNRITNVAAGIDFTDAATVGQLEATTFALGKGWNISAQGANASKVLTGDGVDLNNTDGNITVSKIADDNDVSFNLNKNLMVDSVKTGDSTLNNQGLNIVGGPSITKAGINAADAKITNVVSGDVAANSKDAINGSQLYAQGMGISSIIGGNTTYNPATGTFTNSNIGGTGEGSIDGAIASIKRGETAMTGNIQTNTTNIATNTTNIATNTTNITKNTADIVTNTAKISTNTTNIKANKDKIDAGLNFGADSGAVINKPIGDGSVLSFKGGNNIKTTAEGSSIKFDLNGNINVESVTTGDTTVSTNGVVIAGGPSITKTGIYAGNGETAPSMTAAGINAAGTKVTNVADGMAPRDAVNFGQLDAVSRGLGNSINELGYKIGEVEDDANAGISAAMAMSSLPQAYIIGKPMIGGGIATYNGESAVAIGFSKMSNDGRWVMKLNGTADTQGNVGAAIGAGFHFD